jgi:hypothetical protein
VVDASGRNLTGRAFNVATSDSGVVGVAPFGPTITGPAGTGEFVVTVTPSAVAGQTADVTVSLEGKATVWKVVIT